jgi:hypothetical protein
VSTATSFSDRETWNELRRELRDAGIPSTVIREKKQFIIKRFQDEMMGTLDENDNENFRPTNERIESGSSDAESVPRNLPAPSFKAPFLQEQLFPDTVSSLSDTEVCVLFCSYI